MAIYLNGVIFIVEVFKFFYNQFSFRNKKGTV